MTDTPTDRYGARQQSQGSNVNSWGDDKLNEVLRLFDRGSKGVQSLAMTGSTTLSWTNYVATNDGQVSVLLLTGSLSSAANLVVPSREWAWDIIKNSTGQTVTVKTSAGTGVAIPNGRQVPVYCDGSDCYFATANYIGADITEANARDLMDKSAVETAIATASLTATAGTVLNSATDTTAGYVGQKVTAGTGVDVATQNTGGNENLQIAVNTTELEEFLALTGKVTGTLSSGTTAMTARRRYRISSTATGTLPTMVEGDFVIVEFAVGAGVTGTVGRNSQTIDGESSDDTYIGDGYQGPVIRYDYASAGAVTSRLVEGTPV
jgi:hypothetical protein